jgi:putative Holliday junction resolvase
MGRIIAIDYGKKRTGLAVSDPMKMIAGGLATLPSSGVISFIKGYMEKEVIELILLGEPRQMNYEPSENLQRVEIFKEQLIKAIPSVKIKMVDERFTSVLARQTMLQGGLKKKDRRNKELVDEVSAVIILQSYLETVRK